jgi:serine/threonine protein kinase
MGEVDLSPWVAIRRLGQGGTGEVFLAEKDGRQVALKVLSAETAADARLREQVLTAATALTSVRHAALVRVLEIGQLADHRHYVASDYVEGRDLGEILTLEEALDYERVVGLAKQLCAGLALAHQAGLVHGDLKPSNILVGKQDGSGHESATILDFGTAQTTGTASPLGSPEYWSPEQASGRHTDMRSDIYSLGIILYEALTGSAPFRSHSYSDMVQLQLHTEPSRLVAPAKVRRIPPELQEVVLRCLRKAPGERFANATALAEALALAPPAPRAVPVVTPAAKPRRLAWALASAVSLVLAATVVYALSSSGANEKSPTPPSAQAALETEAVAVAINSKPEGAFVYRSVGGSLLGTTPGTFRLTRGTEAVNLLVRFPDGARAQLRVVPDQPSQLFVRSPRLAAAE